MRHIFRNFNTGRLSVRSRLLLLIAAALLPAAGGFAWLIAQQREQAREAAYAQVRIVASNIAAQIGLVLSNSESALGRLAERPSVRALDPLRCDPVFEDHLLMRRESTALVLRSAEGNLICSSSSNSTPASSAYIAGLGWFRDGLAANGLKVTNATLGISSKRWIVNLTSPVRDDAGKATGLLIMGIDLLKLQELLAQSSPKNAHLAAFDREYKFLMRSIEPEKSIGTPLPPTQLAFIKDRDEAYFPARNIVGVSQLWALITMPQTGWRVAIGVPEDEVLAPSQVDLQRSLAIGIGTLLLMLALTWFISRPIRLLARASAQIIAGDASARARIEGPVEIKAVAAHFNRLLEERESTLATLRMSEERFALATHGSSDGFWDWNIATGECYFSDRLCELLDHTRDELRPHVDTWKGLLHPEDAEQTLRNLQKHLEQRSTYDTEIRMRTKSGEYRWFRARGQALWNEAGQAVRMAGSIVDITERTVLQKIERESQLRLKSILDGIFAFVGLYSLDGILLEANRAPLEAAGLKREDVVGIPFWDTYWWSYSPETQEQVRNALRRAAQGEVVREDFRVRLAEGRFIDIDAMFGPLRDEAGRVTQIIGSAVDISERKGIEEQYRTSLREKETLLREIHHRVKNNLQIISSLLHFQSRKAKGAENLAVFQEGRDRLKSMILVHEKLYQSQNLSRIEFGEYARALLEEIGASYRDSAKQMTLKVEAVAVYLPIETALPLGMLLSELATNVFKYAYPDGRGGELRVTVAGADGQLQLVVADDGAGLPERVNPEAPESFGLRLVANLATQLSGTVRYARGAGLSVEVSVPLAAQARGAEERAA
jgi:PAS domain S-box-containing protein